MKVSWDDYSQLNGAIKFMFQATNQMGISWDFTDKKYVMKILMKSSNQNLVLHHSPIFTQIFSAVNHHVPERTPEFPYVTLQTGHLFRAANLAFAAMGLLS